MSPHRRSYIIPASSRPFEPLALVTAVACLVVHLIAISALNELVY